MNNDKIRFEKLLRNFKRDLLKSGKLKEFREKQYFISKSEKRRIKKKNAIRRNRRERLKEKENG